MLRRPNSVLLMQDSLSWHNTEMLLACKTVGKKGKGTLGLECTACNKSFPPLFHFCFLNKLWILKKWLLKVNCKIFCMVNVMCLIGKKSSGKIRIWLRNQFLIFWNRWFNQKATLEILAFWLEERITFERLRCIYSIKV